MSADFPNADLFLRAYQRIDPGQIRQFATEEEALQWLDARVREERAAKSATTP